MIDLKAIKNFIFFIEVQQLRIVTRVKQDLYQLITVDKTNIN